MIPLENSLRSDVTFFSFSPLPSISFNRLYNGKTVMPWIYSILVYHSRHLMSEESATQTLNSLIKVICDEVLLLLYDSKHFGLVFQIMFSSLICMLKIELLENHFATLPSADQSLLSHRK